MHFTSRQTLLDWVRRGRLERASLPAALALCELPRPCPLAVAVRSAAALAWQPVPRRRPGVLRRLQLAGAGPPLAPRAAGAAAARHAAVAVAQALADSQRQALLLAIALNIGALLYWWGRPTRPAPILAAVRHLGADAAAAGGARPEPVAVDLELAARPAGAGALLAARPVQLLLRLQRGGPRLVPDPVQRRPLGYIAAGARSLPADALLAGGAGRRVRRHPADPAGAVRCRLPWVWPAWLGWLAVPTCAGTTDSSPGSPWAA